MTSTPDPIRPEVVISIGERTGGSDSSISHQNSPARMTSTDLSSPMESMAIQSTSGVVKTSNGSSIQIGSTSPNRECFCSFLNMCRSFIQVTGEIVTANNLSRIPPVVSTNRVEGKISTLESIDLCLAIRRNID
jgi:hypothetical protein